MSKPLDPNDPSQWMLQRGRNEQWAVATGQLDEADATWVTKSEVYNPRCYICNDDEFALMGLPLCTACETCGAHTPADDVECDNGHVSEQYIEAMKELKEEL